MSLGKGGKRGLVKTAASRDAAEPERGEFEAKRGRHGGERTQLARRTGGGKRETGLANRGAGPARTGGRAADRFRGGARCRAGAAVRAAPGGGGRGHTALGTRSVEPAGLGSSSRGESAAIARMISVLSSSSAPPRA